MRHHIKTFLIAAAIFGAGMYGAIKVYADWTGVGVSGNVVFCAKTTGTPSQANCTVQTDGLGDPIYTTDSTATQLVVCNQEAQYDASTSGKTQIVAGSAGKKIYVCGYSLVAAGTVSVDLTQGTTGTACATGTNTKMTPTYQLATTGPAGVLDPSVFGASAGPNVSIVSQALCIETNAAIAVHARVKFAQF